MSTQELEQLLQTLAAFDLETHALPEQQRLVYRLTVMAGMTHKEEAVALHLLSFARIIRMHPSPASLREIISQVWPHLDNPDYEKAFGQFAHTWNLVASREADHITDVSEDI